MRDEQRITAGVVEESAKTTKPFRSLHGGQGRHGSTVLNRAPSAYYRLDVLALVAGCCFIIGLAVGSFLNVVIHRVPLEVSVVTPRSRCPSCGPELASRDNIPVVSWLLLRGKCRTCGASISGRYPIVEFGTGVLFALVAWRFGLVPALPAYLLFTGGMVALSGIDLDTFKLPKKVVYPTWIGTAALLAVAGALDRDWQGLREAAIGGAIGFAVLFVIHVISPRGMGFGDVRLAGCIGTVLGWVELPLVPLGLFLSFLLASVIGVGLIATGLRGRKDRIPFGPFLALGAVIALLVGEGLLDLYLGR
jgi:leader peptidase (prepilin peptidase)/N-methyltransferase